MKEERLVIEAQQGSEAAVELLIRLTYDDIYRFIRWKVHDAELAWDLAQQTYEKAWKKLNAYQSEQGRFQAWLLAIAHHVCIDHARSKSARQAGLHDHLSDEVPNKDDFLEGVLMREELKEVYAAIRGLPDNQRDALLLRYKHDLSFGEMAAVTGESESTVKSRVRRSLIRLRDMLMPSAEARSYKKGEKQ